jgi:hypothetical protein
LFWRLRWCLGKLVSGAAVDRLFKFSLGSSVQILGPLCIFLYLLGLSVRQSF